MTDKRLLPAIDPDVLGDVAALRTEFTRFMLQYQFGVEEVTTKIGILREEFRLLHDYNPIEHVSSRLKSPESIIGKVARKGCDPSFSAIRAAITDIAGVRVTCSFTSDVYRLFDQFTGQSDVTVIEVKDYIRDPKSNGYRSLHAIVEVPVFLSDSVAPVIVEVQFRTVAMDFWASLEHKIYYKYRRSAPAEVLEQLAEAAETAHRLDTLMEDLHQQVHAGTAEVPPPDHHLVPTDEVLGQLRAIRDSLGRG
ncbi:putative GTP pyrophosphokinase [Ornithinicoccus hortensis]|uniref:Putative GTP pyrophosphokinase n=2 Tax=Ornithinicoccus hortensis TaxID=82346 RepID=A0A542YMH8_9MICO|nr:putative GTP pyrophosphokinase [Ornithinicoccus hortensis]